ncbi:deoxyribodipyrimidine photo-lyase [candidate division KSB1 bacterium]|nr:deoxyribodipyrimidine photo-lyase [candidate division KSB1 bacterium]RQW00621.1 MAG: deoxyribodipyrimidine photo-lyase [candidate division KSB1 bacterium]
MKSKIIIFWFRRDLRLFDNAGLSTALQHGLPVIPLFLFDSDILEKLTDKRDKRVGFIREALVKMQEQLTEWRSSLLVKHGKPLNVWKQLVNDFDISAVYTNNDYEPYALQRDAGVQAFLESHGIAFLSLRDQVIFEKDDVRTASEQPYTVFTPYKKKWKQKLIENNTLSLAYPVAPHNKNFWQHEPLPIPSLKETGFTPTHADFPSREIRDEIIQKYHLQRDFPGIAGTSRIGVHVRFGTVSIRDLVKRAFQLNETWLDELIWREFFMMILYHFPHVQQRSFREKYDLIEWRNNENEYERWCAGETGYPLVDAGMRELNQTGFMHNRVRMVTASFLTKHLLIDWRWGERYFAEKLLDYDLSANNGNWQWAAGTGCDAAPYFRVFNPVTQQEKFDSDFIYVKKWVPEYATTAYPEPIVEHKFARQRAIDVYSRAVKG